MNAKEAFRLSEQNERLKAENDFDEAIKNIHQKINLATLDGFYQTSIKYFPCQGWSAKNNDEKIEKYFTDLGYKVKLVELLGPKNGERIVIIKWI